MGCAEVDILTSRQHERVVVIVVARAPGAAFAPARLPVYFSGDE